MFIFGRHFGLSGNALKVIAAFSMLLDHIGLILFPGLIWLRAAGRLAMPVFAYFIAEGMRHTKSEAAYFLRIFITGVVCQIPYTIATGEVYFNILLTFSLSVILIGVFKKIREAGGSDVNSKAVYYKVVFLFAVICVFALCLFVDVDYGFFGVVLPVCAGLFKSRKENFAAFSVCLAVMNVTYAACGRYIQLFSAASVILILLYNGRRGALNMKYFFYVFYPVHLFILWTVSYVING